MRNSPPSQHAVESTAQHSPSDHASRRRDADPAWQPAVRKPKPRNLVAIEERLVVQPLRDATLRQSGWLWPGRIPVGELTLVAGYPGVGKSFLALDLAARVSVGALWPDQPGSIQPPGDVLLALGQFAARANVAVVAFTQFRKDATGPKALRAIGSQAYAAVPRAVWSVNPPSIERQGRRQLAPIKLNLQAEATALDFDVIAGRVVWQETPTPFDCHPTTESRTEREEREEKSAVAQAADWLRRALADEDLPATVIQKESKELGFAWRTVLRAKEEVGVRSVVSQISIVRRWFWTIHDPPKGNRSFDFYPELEN